MQCSNGNIHKKPIRATESHNEQTEGIEHKSAHRRQQKATNDKWKHSPKTKTSNNEQQKAPKSTFNSHVHSFVPTLDLWKVVAMKSQKDQR